MTDSPDKPIRMTIYSVPCCLPVVRAAAECFARHLGFDDLCAGNIILSLDEALTNIIRHAYKGAPDKLIEIELAPFTPPAQGLRICLRDYGPTVDPMQIKPRDLADIRPGGLGVHIMSKCMDKLEYAPAPGGGMTLTMTKALTQPDKGQTK